MTDRKKYRSKVVDTSEKMKRKKNCNDPPSSYSKNKCNHLSSIDSTVDPTFFNPIDPTVNHPPSSSNLICNEDISFFNNNHIKKTDKAYYTLVKIFYSNMYDINRDDHKFKSLMRNPQVENEVEADDDEAQAQDVPNSSTAGVPNSSTAGVPNSSTTGLPPDPLQSGDRVRFGGATNLRWWMGSDGSRGSSVERLWK
ncbi:unnamed protein product [Ilex paraguariensis]|uniref:Uncharacterized protein n=1 Tax=Ilex paraguariensis TaxID=185542 RepID=A0ABC8T766_9AQUA